jgi:prepilin-type N-terminal cleavage/methylation domain-containing protein
VLNSKSKIRPRGFTLVELIVALAIASILILAVKSAFSLGLRLWKRVEDRRPLEEQGRQVVGMLRSELAGAYLPPRVEGEGPVFRRARVEETGGQVLSFFTTTPSCYRGLLPGRCARVTYEYRKEDGKDDSSGVLIRREQLVAGEKSIGEPFADVIATGLSSFSLTYTENDGDGSKEEAGPRSTKPPKLVRLSIGWPAKNAVTGQPEPVSFSAQFMVPVKGPLLPKETSS